MPNKTISLDQNVIELLKNTDNASRYISKAVEARATAWQSAHNHLISNGWKPRELSAACDALNGYSLLDPYAYPATWAAAELADGAKLNGLCKKWDIAPKRWGELCKRIAESEHEARALCAFADEFWADNRAAGAVLER